MTARSAIVHDWLYTYAGAEKVLEQMLQVLPDADLFSLFDFLPSNERQFLKGKPVTTTFLQRMPWMRSSHRLYLPFMPLAVESLDLSGYNLVVSSSYAVAKGVITGPDQVHVSMCYSPMRYAWDLRHQYLDLGGFAGGIRRVLAEFILHYIRIWDVRTANSVDHFIAISEFVSRRIRKLYRREAHVIYPPVSVDQFPLSSEKGDYYVTASRLVPYKRVDLLVQAFTENGKRRLVVIGDGPQRKELERQAGDNVQFLGQVTANELQRRFGEARAFVFAAVEDFGIAPLEAQACGTPVIAYRKGGAVETIRDLAHSTPTGLFFDEQAPMAVNEALDRFEAMGGVIDPVACRKNAERFSEERFIRQFRDFISDRC